MSLEESSSFLRGIVGGSSNNADTVYFREVKVLLEHEGIGPQIAEDVYVAPTAVVCGDVRIGAGSRILFGAILTAEGGPVEIGEHCIVMENALVRGRATHPTRIGDHVLIGPHAHINGAVVEDAVFLATGAAVFPGAHLGARSEVRINAVVHVNSHLPPGTTVPIGWVAVGDPAQLFPPDAHEDLWSVQQEMQFTETVYGVDRAEEGSTIMPEITQQYADLFGRHLNDRIIE